MLFNSLHFLLFFPLVTGLYFLLPQARRWQLLLAASCYFYMAFIPAYLLILLFLIVVDYFAGLAIDGSAGRTRKAYLVLSLIANLGILGIFKYFNFFSRGIADLLHVARIGYDPFLLSVILPIGLSFHTFQSMSYTIEVYWGRQKPERHFGIYALYVMFYPQLVAGPIERPQNLLHQFRERHDFDYSRVVAGLKLMLWGFFKKAVVADRLAFLVNQVYGSPRDYSGVALLIATYGFTFQVYCDFSGYSDIAIGAAQVMGFRLMKNFDRPFFSETTAEFWRRWHISLSSWFRDYLYLPMGGSRVPRPRRYFNLFAVFALCGLWHGAAWTYVGWGSFVGICLVFALITKTVRGKLAALSGLDRLPGLYRLWKVAITIHLFAAGLVVFRAHSLSDAGYIAARIFEDVPLTATRALAGVSLKPIAAKIGNLGLSPFDLLLALLGVLVLMTVEFLQGRRPLRPAITAWPAWARWSGYYAVIASILLFGKFTARQFIYFQF
ncbi:MAG: MBOAT family O-acyltransferase [Bryobacteraceae bacterium]